MAAIVTIEMMIFGLRITVKGMQAVTVRPLIPDDEPRPAALKRDNKMYNYKSHAPGLIRELSGERKRKAKEGT